VSGNEVVKSHTAVKEEEMFTPEGLIEHLRSLQRRIPEYAPLPAVDAKSIRPAATVDPEFAQVGIAAIASTETVQNLLGTSPDALKAEMDESARWTSAEYELRNVLKGLEATNLVRRHRIGLTLLQTYSIARQLIRKKEYAFLVPHVETMQRLYKASQRRRVKPEPPADTAAKK
jgi:hypothetical protein